MGSTRIPPATLRASCSTTPRTARSSLDLRHSAGRWDQARLPRMTQTLAASPLTQAELIAKYDGRAPRYTSYPTAVQFTPQVTAETYRNWLSELSTFDPVSLYLHIPF